MGWTSTFHQLLQVDVVSHLVLQVYLGPTGEKTLYHFSMTTVTGQHESSPAILRNRMGQSVDRI